MNKGVINNICSNCGAEFSSVHISHYVDFANRQSDSQWQIDSAELTGEDGNVTHHSVPALTPQGQPVRNRPVYHCHCDECGWGTDQTVALNKPPKAPPPARKR